MISAKYECNFDSNGILIRCVLIVVSYSIRGLLYFLMSTLQKRRMVAYFGFFVRTVDVDQQIRRRVAPVQRVAIHWVDDDVIEDAEMAVHRVADECGVVAQLHRGSVVLHRADAIVEERLASGICSVRAQIESVERVVDGGSNFARDRLLSLINLQTILH